jgi:transcriptional regulator CtsR
MKQLIIGLTIGLAVGLTCTACSIAKGIITAEPMQVVLTERNNVTTTKVTTEEGTYRIFTIESTDGKGGVGISAVKIK